MTTRFHPPRRNGRPHTLSQDREWLWVHWGDASSYEPFDAISEADFAYRFSKGACVSGFVERGFLVAPDFVGFNYVSCFWGDAQTHPVRELDSQEKQTITALVGSL